MIKAHCLHGIALIVLAALLPLGCAQPTKTDTAVAKERPDPLEAFNTLCNLAMKGDKEYLRSHMTPELLAQAGGNADQFLAGYLLDLERCRAMNCGTTNQANKVVLGAAKISPQGIRLIDVDYIYDAQKGWLIGSKFENDRPWQKQG